MKVLLLLLTTFYFSISVHASVQTSDKTSKLNEVKHGQRQFFSKNYHDVFILKPVSDEEGIFTNRIGSQIVKLQQHADKLEITATDLEMNIRQTGFVVGIPHDIKYVLKKIDVYSNKAEVTYAREYKDFLGVIVKLEDEVRIYDDLIEVNSNAKLPQIEFSDVAAFDLGLPESLLLKIESFQQIDNEIHLSGIDIVKKYTSPKHSLVLKFLKDEIVIDYENKTYQLRPLLNLNTVLHYKVFTEGEFGQKVELGFIETADKEITFDLKQKYTLDFTGDYIQEFDAEKKITIIKSDLITYKPFRRAFTYEVEGRVINMKAFSMPMGYRTFFAENEEDIEYCMNNTGCDETMIHSREYYILKADSNKLQIANLRFYVSSFDIITEQFLAINEMISVE